MWILNNIANTYNGTSVKVPIVEIPIEYFGPVQSLEHPHGGANGHSFPQNLHFVWEMGCDLKVTRLISIESQPKKIVVVVEVVIGVVVVLVHLVVVVFLLLNL